MCNEDFYNEEVEPLDEMLEELEQQQLIQIQLEQHQLEEFLEDQEREYLLSEQNIILFELTSNNEEYYNSLVELMKNKQSLSLLVGIQEGIPYYATELHETLKPIFITPEIYKQIHHYLKEGIVTEPIAETSDIYMDKTETFILQHLKIDGANGKTTCSRSTNEYKATYPNGVINYGKLPYTIDELTAKLDSL